MTGRMRWGRMSDQTVAEKFHDAYERLAPAFGYETRHASRKPWAEVPEQNKQLMIAVAKEVLLYIADVSRDAARAVAPEEKP